MTTQIPEPTIVRRDRSITYEWRLATEPSTHGTVTHMAVLRITHFGAAQYVGRPSRVYIATLSIEDETREPGRLPMRSFKLYATPTVEIARHDAPRFSSKRLEQLARDAYARVQELLAAGDPDVTALFTAEGEPC